MESYDSRTFETRSFERCFARTRYVHSLLFGSLSLTPLNHVGKDRVTKVLADEYQKILKDISSA